METCTSVVDDAMARVRRPGTIEATLPARGEGARRNQRPSGEGKRPSTSGDGDAECSRMVDVEHE